MAAITITPKVDDIDGLTVHFETGRPEGALFWSWDHDGGSLQAPADTSFRFPVPGDYTVTARAQNGDEGTVDVTVPGSGGGGGGPVSKLLSVTPNTAVVGFGQGIHFNGENFPQVWAEMTASRFTIGGVPVGNPGIAAPGTVLTGTLQAQVPLLTPGVYDVGWLGWDGGVTILPGAFTVT